MSLDIVAAVGHELEQAIERDQRRSHMLRLGPRALALAAMALLLLGAAVGAATGWLPVGSVIPAGRDALPREGNHLVVATGRAKVAGPWRLEVYTSGRLADPHNRTVYQPPGLPCIDIILIAPPAGIPTRGAGQCGTFRGAPGFGYSELRVADARGRRERLVFGRAPRRAVRVSFAVAGGGPTRSVTTRPGPRGTHSDFWLMSAPAVSRDARLRWFDADGHTSGRRLVVPGAAAWEYAGRRSPPPQNR
jgi:hypothetical protein